MKYEGSCHCGDIRFEVEGHLDGATACNCSICERKGSLLWFVPRTAFHLLTPEDNIASYTFNKHAIVHRFCKRCGIHPYAEGAMPDGTPMAAINVRCLEAIDLGAVRIHHYDGRAL